MIKVAVAQIDPKLGNHEFMDGEALGNRNPYRATAFTRNQG